MIDKQEIIVRPATIEDAVPVCRLLKELGLDQPYKETDIRNHWLRLWDKNPYYKTFPSKPHYGHVMTHNERIVGFFGDIPRIYLKNNIPISVSIASQWGIEKAYREYKNLLCDAYFIKNKSKLKLVTTAIKPTGYIFRNYKGVEVPRKELNLVYMIPLQLFNLMALKFTNSQINGVLRRLNRLIPWNFQYIWRAKNPEIVQVDSENLPLELNQFFETYEARINGLIAKRSVELIQWHNSKFSRKNPKSYFLLKNGNNIRGFAAISKDILKDRKDLVRFKLIDIVALNSKDKKELLKEIQRYCSMENGDVLECHHPGMLNKEEISSVFVLTRKHKYFPLFFQTEEEELKSYLSQGDLWNITPYDGDTSL